MDGLEDRVVLSAAAAPAISWVGGATGDWNVAENWSGSAVPTASDDVSISNAVVTVDTAAMVNNLTTSANVTLVFNAGMGITGDGTFLNEGTISKPASGGASSIGIRVDNQGSILVGAGGTLDLSAKGLVNYTGTTLTGGTYKVAGTLGISGAISTLASGTNISLDGGSALIKNTTQTAPPSNNALRGLKTIKPGASLTIKDLALTMNQELTNEGNLKIQAGKLTLQDAFVNDGSITIGIAGPTSGVVGGYGVLEVATDGATLGGTLVAEFVNYTPSSFPESYSVINTGTRTSPDITGAIGFTQPTSLPPGVVMTRSTTPSGDQYYRGVNLTIDKLVLQSITVTPNNPGIAKGETKQFTATANYQGGTTADLTGYATWSAADKTGGPNVASIDAITGEAKGLNVGEATIAASYDGVTGSTILNVGQARLLSLVVSPTSATIAKGQTATFTATGNYTDGPRDVTSQADWTSSNNYASITAPGKARGDGVGDATITAKLGGQSVDVGLTVKDAEFLSLTISPIGANIAKGETATFTAIAEYTDGFRTVTSEATWDSSDASVATITAGQAKGLGVSVDGPVTITAAFDGKTATATLTVDEARLLSFTISPTNQLLYLGQTQQYTARGTFTDGQRDATDLVNWVSSNGSVATIDAHGLATALTSGQTTISANYEGLTSATTTLNVDIQAVVSATSVSWGSMTAPLATAADGVRLLPSGRSYGDTIGWAGINRINITLDHDAVLTAADITVTSLANINYGTVTVTGSGKNWVITLANKIDVADRVTFSINNNPGIQPFERRLDVLPGDVNGDGVVSLQDVIYIRNGMQNFEPILLPIYFLDVVGDGGTKPTQNSLTAALRRFGTQLPSLT